MPRTKLILLNRVKKQSCCTRFTAWKATSMPVRLIKKWVGCKGPIEGAVCAS